MKILLIGLGGMGKNHLRVLSENPAVRTLYIFDVNSEVVNHYADSDPKMSAIHDLDNFIDSNLIPGDTVNLLILYLYIM